MSLEPIKAEIERRKAELDALRPLRGEALAALERLYDIELTYASNAIEGNTLSPSETQLVVEKGITIAGKSVREHLEAVDHFEALAYVRSLAAEQRPITESDVRNLHSLVVRRSSPDIAGRYADRGRFVINAQGDRAAFAPPAELPALMGDFGRWLQVASCGPQDAFDAHRKLVMIHPFNDGNGRTARLLMNLLLIRDGYPPVSIRPRERSVYIDALAEHQAGAPPDAFNLLLFERLRDTLVDYVAALQQAAPGQGSH